MLSRWTEEVPPPVVEQCLKVLADFGLEQLYGEGPLPIGAETAPGGAPGRR